MVAEHADLGSGLLGLSVAGLEVVGCAMAATRGALMDDRFEDERGVIQDLLTEPIDSITRITTRQGAVRGNHVHKLTTQWTYVLTGNLWICNGKRELLLGPGEICRHGPGEPHAWKATQDTDCLVFTRGPRAGENYEDDTERLQEPLLT